MTTRASTIEFLLDQLSALPSVSARRMFGEYCLYCDGKPVALVCDDQLFLKPTDAGRALIGTPPDGTPFPTARPHFLISADLWDDAEHLCRLVRATADVLPVPKPKARKRPAA